MKTIKGYVVCGQNDTPQNFELSDEIYGVEYALPIFESVDEANYAALSMAALYDVSISKLSIRTVTANVDIDSDAIPINTSNLYLNRACDFITIDFKIGPD
jgi:hypothetical protein